MDFGALASTTFPLLEMRFYSNVNVLLLRLLVYMVMMHFGALASTTFRGHIFAVPPFVAHVGGFCSRHVPPEKSKETHVFLHV